MGERSRDLFDTYRHVFFVDEREEEKGERMTGRLGSGTRCQWLRCQEQGKPPLEVNLFEQPRRGGRSSEGGGYREEQLTQQPGTRGFSQD
jgi:hypothetical protein